MADQTSADAESSSANFEIDTEAFVENIKNKNTKRKTEGDVKKFVEFIKEQDELRKPEELDDAEFDKNLGRFFLLAKRKDGKDYEPDILKAFQTSLQRHLSEKRPGVNIIEDNAFKHSRDVLIAKRKQLKQSGLGYKPNRAEPFTKEEINLLYEQNFLGIGNPKSLINTMLMNNTMYFGMRSRLEHIELKWGDIELKTTSSGEEYLEHSERATKTRSGQTSDSRSFLPKMFASPGNSRCPVRAYKKYAEKRPVEMLKDESPFYIGIARGKAQENGILVYKTKHG